MRPLDIPNTAPWGRVGGGSGGTKGAPDTQPGPDHVGRGRSGTAPHNSRGGVPLGTHKHMPRASGAWPRPQHCMATLQPDLRCVDVWVARHCETDDFFIKWMEISRSWERTTRRKAARGPRACSVHAPAHEAWLIAWPCAQNKHWGQVWQSTWSVAGPLISVS